MVYVFLANGFEDVEAITPFDFLKRAGVDVEMIGVPNKNVVSSAGLKFDLEKSIEDLDVNYIAAIEGVVLPGGIPGTKNLDSNQTVHEIIEFCYENSLLIASICAAPSIVGKMGFLTGKKVTCYPGCEQYLEGADVTDDYVAIDGNFITSKGPGTAVLFSIAIIQYLKGLDVAERVANEVQCPMAKEK